MTLEEHMTVLTVRMVIPAYSFSSAWQDAETLLNAYF